MKKLFIVVHVPNTDYTTDKINIKPFFTKRDKDEFIRQMNVDPITCEHIETHIFDIFSDEDTLIAVPGRDE